MQTYLRERVKEVLSGASESIVVRVFGPDVDVLTKKAEEIAAQMATIDGFVDPHVEQIEQIPQIEVEVDVAAARATGSRPGTSAASRPALLASEEVADIFHEGKAYDVHVWNIPTARDSVSDVENLPIDTPDGESGSAPRGRRHRHPAGCEHHQARAANPPRRCRRSGRA